MPVNGRKTNEGYIEVNFYKKNENWYFDRVPDKLLIEGQLGPNDVHKRDFKKSDVYLGSFFLSSESIFAKLTIIGAFIDKSNSDLSPDSNSDPVALRLGDVVKLKTGFGPATVVECLHDDGSVGIIWWQEGEGDYRRKILAGEWLVHKL